ncbi:ATP-dependent Clp protease ATP-binding subunit ClpX, partial [bacterium D16-51]
MANKNEICFLCGKPRAEVGKLLKGKSGYVCDECIHEAYEVINEKEEEEISHNVKLATPSQIKAHLDQ